MEDYIGLIILAIFYILSASSKKKKKAERRRRKAAELDTSGRTIAANAQQVKRKPERKTDSIRTPRTEAGRSAVSHAEYPIQESVSVRCEEDRLHLHQVTQTQMEAAAEGEDPCHKGGEREPDISAKAHEHAYAQVTDPGENVLQSDILRGVIMSEILMRPEQRRALRNGRWRA